MVGPWITSWLMRLTPRRGWPVVRQPHLPLTSTQRLIRLQSQDTIAKTVVQMHGVSSRALLVKARPMKPAGIGPEMCSRGCAPQAYLVLMSSIASQGPGGIDAKPSILSSAGSRTYAGLYPTAAVCCWRSGHDDAKSVPKHWSFNAWTKHRGRDWDHPRRRPHSTASEQRLPCENGRLRQITIEMVRERRSTGLPRRPRQLVLPLSLGGFEIAVQ